MWRSEGLARQWKATIDQVQELAHVFVGQGEECPAVIRVAWLLAEQGQSSLEGR